MDAAKLKEVLKTEYGIRNIEEFDAAVKRSAGINRGIFTMPLSERSVIGEQKTEKTVIA